MNRMNARNRRFPSFLLAAAFGVTAAGPVLLTAPAAQAADDWYKDVRPDRLPEPVRVALENDAAGSSELRFYEVRPHVFAVRYTKPYGLRMETKVNDEGQILARGETTAQPNLKGREQVEAARAAFAREEAERQAARDAAVRAQGQAEGEREARARLRAEKEAERDALYQQHLQDIQRLEADARRQKAAGDARRMSEEWNADRIFPAWREQLPDDVRRTFDRQTNGATGIRYYSYIVGDQTYYSAHFAAAEGHRAEVRVDPGGQLLGRRDVTTAEEDRFLDRERWVRDQWRPHDEHREEHVVVAPAQPVPVVANGRAVKIKPDESPAAVRETMRREARSGQYVEFYRVDVPGRDNDQFIVGYTDAAGRRIHVQLNREGQILERRELIEGHERPLR